MSVPEQPTFEEIFKAWVPDPDDRFDADVALDLAMADAAKNGDIVYPPLESMNRIRSPLTPESEKYFGDFIVRAFNRTDLD